MELNTLSKTEYAYRELRNRIITGELPAGTLISESTLSRQLGVSRTPVREAIRMLAREGFIDAESTFSRVHSLSVKEICDLNEVRLTLEETALKTSITRIPEDEISAAVSEWRSILDLMESPWYDREKVLERIFEADYQTHLLTIRYCENTVIPALYENLLARITWSQGIISTLIRDDQRTVQYHLDFLDRIRSRDLAGSIWILKSHVMDSLYSIRAENLTRGNGSLNLPKWT